MSSSFPHFISSPLLPVPHGFALRTGGVSEGPFASLNFGRSSGDERSRLEENYARLARALDARVGDLCTVSQVHGDRVVEARSPRAGDALAAPVAEADGVWTGEPGTWTSVLTADCVPLLLVDPEGQRVAAVHSGWKGTRAEIARRAVEALCRAGSRPGRLLAAIGPSIRRCCYTVSEPLAGEFASAFGPELLERDAGNVRLDLVAAVRRSLRASGVAEGQIDTLPACTACEPERFFSHRRDAGRTGRHLNFVVNRF